MGRRFSRKEVLERLWKTVKLGKPILGAGCSVGLVAKCAEIGGADLIIAYSTGLSRIKGLPTTLFGPMDSNAVTLSMFEELDNVVKETPIIGGVDASDPTCLDLKKLIMKFLDVGFSGIINFPTMGLFGDREPASRYRISRDSQGLGWIREVELMRRAREMGVFTMAYVFNPEDAEDMAKVPVDVLVAHVGGTSGGLAGFKAKPLQEAAEAVQKIVEAAKAINPRLICLAHGGPFADPEDTKYLYLHTDVVGFVGASSIERIPIEKAVTDVVRRFKSYSLKQWLA
ncbi:MAG: phosphoenolpyruvate hydrolase family protein [Candidatus Bathyarchaeia archaeon]